MILILLHGIGEIMLQDLDSQRTHPAGQKKANSLGLYDMSGNAYEWCWDWYDTYNPAINENPKGPEFGRYRILRGGSWNDYYDFCRVSRVFNFNPNGRNLIIGFRLSKG